MRVLLALCCFFIAAAQAHLMPAQRGTLNHVNNDVYMVLTLPASAFTAIDDNGDGAVSLDEFNRNRIDVASQIRSQISLGKLSLEGLLLSPVVSHAVSKSETSPLEQITVMGRFAGQATNTPLEFRVDLFGAAQSERSLTITAQRRSDGRQERFELTPQKPTKRVFEYAD